MKSRFTLPIILTSIFATSACGASYSLSISADTTRFDYAETDETGSLLDTEKSGFGDISGFTLSLDPAFSGFYLTTSYSSGESDYVGGTTSDPTYGSHRTTTENTIVDYSAGFKSIVPLGMSGEVEMPFKIGLGYREWSRDIQSTQSVLGYEEIYEWGYFDVGIGLHFPLSPVASLGVDASYRKAFSAQMRENLYGITFDLNNVYGYTIAVPLEVALGESMNLFFRYQYEYWNIGASNDVRVGTDYYYEPDSETKNQTLSAGIRFWF